MVREIDKPLHHVNRLPDINHLCAFSSLLDLLQVGYRLCLVLQLVELNGLLLLFNVLLDAVVDECQLQRGALPCLREQVRERKLYILWLALVEKLKQCHKLLRVKTLIFNLCWQFEVLNFSKPVEYLAPVQS